MTEKLYADNALLRSCRATVINCEEENGRYLVELDRTVFFPEGGGQLSDKGVLGAAAVSHVFEKQGRIFHVCDRPLPPGSDVEASLDWKTRLDRMQQHTGEHLLSYAFWHLFGAHNVGFHMNETSVTIDLDQEFTAADIYRAEDFTNELIWENRKVNISYVDSSQVVVLPLRKFNSALRGVLRIVSVEGADVCTCCGTHTPFTGMVGSVKIIRWTKHKTGLRIEFLCGRRAVADARSKNSELLGIAAALSCQALDAGEHVRYLQQEIASCRAALMEQTGRLLELKLRQAAAEAEFLPDGRRLLSFIAADGKESKIFCQKLAQLERCVGVVIAAQPERISYAVALGNNTDGDCRGLMKILNAAFGGRGGGKPEAAQGGAPFCKNWREVFYAAITELRGELEK